MMAVKQERTKATYIFTKTSFIGVSQKWFTEYRMLTIFKCIHTE